MKNKIIRLLVFLMSISLLSGISLFLTGCNRNNFRLDPNMLTGFRAVFCNNVVALGITDDNTNRDDSIGGRIASLAKPTENAPNLASAGTSNLSASALVGVDTLGRASEVFFERIGNEEDILTQEQIRNETSAIVTQLYVADDFIYFMLSVSGHRVDNSWWASYQYREINGRTVWYNDDENRVFLIDRSNNNIYALPSYFHSFNITNNVIVAEVTERDMEMGMERNEIGAQRVYKLEIHNDRVTYTLLNPNPAFRASDVIAGDSAIFIEVPTMHQEYIRHPEIANVVFFRSLSKFRLCTRGDIYKVTYYADRTQIQVFNNGNWTAPTRQNIELNLTRAPVGRIIAGGGGLYSIANERTLNISGNEIYVFVRGVIRIRGWGFDRRHKVVNNTGAILGVSSIIKGADMWSFVIERDEREDNWLLAGNDFFVRERNGRLYYLEIGEATLIVAQGSVIPDSAWTRLIQHRPTLALERSYANGDLFAVHHNPLGSVRYIIYLDAAGDIGYILESERTFETTFITLLPLF